MAWSDSGQVTQSILGIKGMQQQKKNDRWAKLMDIANVLQNTAGLGADLWKTISGRKYQTSEREAGQQFATSERESAENFQRDMATTDLAQKKEWLDYQNKNPGKPADQLYAEWLMTDAGREWQAEQERLRREGETFDTGLRLQEIRAGKSGGLSESGWTAYEKAIDQARNQFYMLDEAGAVVLKPGVTQDMVKNFLYGFARSPFADEADIPGLQFAFDRWLENPDFAGGTAETQKDDVSALVQAVLEAYGKIGKGQIESGAPTELPGPAPRSLTTVSDSGTAFGTAFMDAANRERVLEEGLGSLAQIPGIEPTDKAVLDAALKDSKRTGYLSEEKYRGYTELLKILSKKYESLRKGLTK